jgi:hypothetical protein
MLLGDMLARLEDETVAAEALLALRDLALLTRVKSAAARDDLTAGEFTVMSVDYFIAHASDQDWLTLSGLMARAEDPGQVFLRRVLSDALAERAQA